MSTASQQLISDVGSMASDAVAQTIQESSRGVDVPLTIDSAINNTESLVTSYRQLSSIDSENDKSEYITSLNNIVNTIKSLINHLIDVYNEKYKNYFYLKYHLIEILNFAERKRKKIENLRTKKETYQQNSHIDNRKNTYESLNYEFYKNMNFYILILYYILIICYLIFTPFFKEKKYLNYTLVLIILLYIFLPFILPYILVLIYNMYEYVLEVNNLKEEIISYPYIIEDKEKYE